MAVIDENTKVNPPLCPDPEKSSEKSDLIKIKRKGGGSIIRSRPIFSSDSNYVYLNCGWGVKGYSVSTGEAVRTYQCVGSAQIISIFLIDDNPAAVDLQGCLVVWDAKNGKILLKKNLSPSMHYCYEVFNAFLVPTVPTSICLVFIPPRARTYEDAIVRFYCTSGKAFSRQPLAEQKFSIWCNTHSVDVGGGADNPFIALISSNSLRVATLDGKSDIIKHQDLSRTWNCVRCHPSRDTVAAGDSSGRVVVFNCILSAKCVPAVYHWHSLPCREVAFSSAGASIFTGGGEHVLVKWDLENPTYRYFLPRLSADIIHIMVAPDNQFVAVSTVDNGIQIVSASNKLHCVLQQLSWAIPSQRQANHMFPAGLHYDLRSGGLLLNGRPGHLQLFSPVSETISYTVDVTMMNYLTQEREKVIINTDVTHTALTSDSVWLATVETRSEKGLALELRLKFWLYVIIKKRFSLTTSIELPHDGEVCAIKFAPGVSDLVQNDDEVSSREYYLVTTGNDGKMRTWCVEKSEPGKNPTWICRNSFDYRGLIPGPISFSDDGSVLSAGFGHCLTLWDTEKAVLKHSLTRDSKCLKEVQFGQKPFSHLVVAATRKRLMCWNLFTLNCIWTKDLLVNILIADPLSPYMAVFNRDSLYIFEPASSEPVYQSGKIFDDNEQAVTAVFAPKDRIDPEDPPWLRHSYIYFIDMNQEMNCICPANEKTVFSSFQLNHVQDENTIFSSFLRQTTSGKLPKKQPKQLGVLGTEAVSQFLMAPAHTLPPVSFLTASFLQSLIITKNTGPSQQVKPELKMEVTESDSSDSEEIKVSIKTPKKRLRKEIQSPPSQVNLEDLFPDAAADPDEDLFVLDE